MIERKHFLEQIKQIHSVNSVCAILGPRQCGKTTLATSYRQSIEEKCYVFDLEDPTDLEKLSTPKLTLETLDGLIVIDEIQRRPEIFPYLRVLIDRYPDRRYLILGSVSRDLIQQSSETLAGRIGYLELTPFQLSECHDLRRLWERGGFPKSYLGKSLEISWAWRKAYIATFLERDILNLGLSLSSQEMRRLWTMLAHYHGNILNYSELGKSLSLSNGTIRRYIYVLEGSFMIRTLRPWFENIKKRQVKSPKVYIRDSGLFQALLNIQENLILHPKVGASWEGFALEEIIRFHDADQEDCYFWATSNQAELDLLIVRGSQRMGFEFKYTDAPKMSRSLHSALEDLKLEKITVITPGDMDFLIHEKVRAVGLKNYVLSSKQASLLI
ncbi:MAG: ATP-binding protein [Alphaproteobacteria bacterium]|nr:ATP-binding protein [Alphaproteobacteria bacterium]